MNGERPRRFQRVLLGAGMTVALFIIERRVVTAMRRRGEGRPTKATPPPKRGINVEQP